MQEYRPSKFKAKTILASDYDKYNWLVLVS